MQKRRIAAVLATMTLVVGALLGAAIIPADTGVLPDTIRPQITADTDRSKVELGTRFTPTVDGTATGVQFYNNSRSAGVSSVSVWGPDGKRLAKVAVKNTSTIGWRTIPVDVQVRAGQQYTVSVFDTNGRYPATNRYFTSPRTISGLQVPVNAGVYRYAASSSFPSESWQASSYLVDVTFRAGAAATPPPTSSPTSTPTPEPTAVPSPTPSSSATPGAGYPTATSVGLPDEWQPSRTITGEYRVSTAGAVVENVRFQNAQILVTAPNVTFRNVEGVNSYVNNFVSTCQPGMVIEGSEFRRDTRTGSTTEVVTSGGYTVRNSSFTGYTEGLRVGAKSWGCGSGVTVENTFVSIVPPVPCGDWHGDGIQGYDGGPLRVRNVTIIMNEDGCGGTAPIFYPSGQGNTSVDIDGLIVSGGGYPFRLGTPGTVRNLNIVDRTWGYGPTDVNCTALTAWDARVVTLDANGQPKPVRALACGGVGN